MRKFITKQLFFVILLFIVLGSLLLFLQFPYSYLSLNELTVPTHPRDDIPNAVTGHKFEGYRTREFPSHKRMYKDGYIMDPPSLGLSYLIVATACDRWAVMTTINPPTEALNKIRSLSGWCVIIVCDKRTSPLRIKDPNVFYLEIYQQEQMMHDMTFHSFMELLPWNHFGRKNLGYLFAMINGARLIFDVDDDNILLGNVILPHETELIHTNCGVFNPYPLMGGINTSWPRGYPLSSLHESCSLQLETITSPNITIFQSLANYEPDVDAIFRLTQHTSFDFNGTKNLIYPKGVLAPFNAQATLFRFESFWTLMLPISVHGRVADIWRSYWAQRLMWDVHQNVAFVQPLVIQKRNPHDYLKDMDAELPLYFKSHALVNYLLHEWQCNSTSLITRMEDLLINLYEREYIEESDVLLVQQWLRILHLFHYPFPTIHDSYSVLTERAPRCSHYVKVLITGITGLIGSHVAAVLIKKPCYRVYGLVRPRSDLTNLQGLLTDLTLITGDITDAYRMQTLIADIRPDYLYHFAAQAINSISYDQPELTLDANVKGTLHLLEALRRADCLDTRFFLAGSSTEYGLTADQWDGPIPESAPLQPITPYGVSKAASEMQVMQYHHAFGLPVVVGRFFIQIGPGGTESLAIQQFCKQIAMVEAELMEPLILHGNLATSRDMTDVEEIAPIIVKMVETSPPGQAYNIGTGYALSTEQLLELAISLSRSNIETKVDPSRYRVYDEKVLVADNKKLRDLTNWSSHTPIIKTVESILNYWRKKINILYGKKLEMITKKIEIECPFSNIDLFIVTHRKDMPMLTLMLQSLEIFMPCHGDIHVVMDKEDLTRISTWIPASLLQTTAFHILEAPANFTGIPGYILQAWAMMWADEYIYKTGSDAEYVMFLDTDVVFGLPVTCKALFDSTGRIIQAGWQFDAQPQFQPSCDFLIGKCDESFMSFFPFTMPIDAFGPMRDHIEIRTNTTDFNAAFRKLRDTQNILAFSQFVVMGNYVKQYHQDKVKSIMCPHKDRYSKEMECASFVPVAVHYGWEYCYYVGSCNDVGKHRNEGGDACGGFSSKYGKKTIELIEDVIFRGQCFKAHLWNEPSSELCSKVFVSEVHPELDFYKKGFEPKFLSATFEKDLGSSCKNGL